MAIRRMRPDLEIPAEIKKASRPPLGSEVRSALIWVIVCASLSLALWSSGATDEPGVKPAPLWEVVATGGVFGLMVAVMLMRSRQRANERDLLIAHARARIEEADAQVVDEEGFAAIWTASHTRLDFYHELALDQSKRSFLYGIMAAAMGLVTAVVCAVIAARASSLTGAIAAGGIGALTTALSGYVGTTFMRAYLLASRQLRAYFEQAAESWRYLSAERLVEQIQNPERRDEAVAALALRVVDGATGREIPVAQVDEVGQLGADQGA